MNSIIFLALAIFYIVLTGFRLNSFKWYTKSGHIDFYSHTLLEDIKARNDKVVSVIDSETGKIEFTVPINAYIFEMRLMQEQFTENFMETEKYPDAKFSGFFADMNTLDFNKDGTYIIRAKGKLNLHGIIKEVIAKGTLTLKDNSLKVVALFNLNPEDYNIIIPSAVKSKISKSIEINLKCNYIKLRA